MPYLIIITMAIRFVVAFLAGIPVCTYMYDCVNILKEMKSFCLHKSREGVNLLLLLTLSLSKLIKKIKVLST